MERVRLGLTPLEPLLDAAASAPLAVSRREVVGRQLPPAWHANVNTARCVAQHGSSPPAGLMAEQ